MSSRSVACAQPVVMVLFLFAVRFFGIAEVPLWLLLSPIWVPVCPGVLLFSVLVLICLSIDWLLGKK